MQTKNQPGNCSLPLGTYRSGATASHLLGSKYACYQAGLVRMRPLVILFNNMKVFNNHSCSRSLPRFIEGIYWVTSLFLRTPCTEGCAGANKKASPPGRQQCCTFSPTTFSSVQFSSFNSVQCSDWPSVHFGSAFPWP